jgi:hypothetical protein
MALGVTHKWPKAFPVIGFFGAESETQQARRCALSIDREPEQTHHWTVIQSGAVACGFRRRIPILRSAYVPREALGITASGSFAPRAPCTHSSLWMTVSKKGIYTFPAQLL